MSFCIQNEEFCIRNEELRIKNDEFCRRCSEYLRPVDYTGRCRDCTPPCSLLLFTSASQLGSTCYSIRLLGTTCSLLFLRSASQLVTATQNKLLLAATLLLAVSHISTSACHSYSKQVAAVQVADAVYSRFNNPNANEDVRKKDQTQKFGMVRLCIDLQLFFDRLSSKFIIFDTKSPF